MQEAHSLFDIRLPFDADELGPGLDQSFVGGRRGE